MLRFLSVACAFALLAALLPFPIGYYTFLRILVCIGSLSILFTEVNAKRRTWAIVFLIVGVVFNPIFPVWLYQKQNWMLIDSGCAALFFSYAYFGCFESSARKSCKTR